MKSIECEVIILRLHLRKSLYFGGGLLTILEKKIPQPIYDLEELLLNCSINVQIISLIRSFEKV